MPDYYNLLRVAPEASAEAIRAAFRREAKRHHPDANPHLPPEEREARQRHFILLAQAYDTLSDPARRAEYDRRRKASQGGTAPTGGPKSRHAGAGRGARPAPPRSARAGSAGPRTGAPGAESGGSARGPAGGKAGGQQDVPDWDDLLRDVEGLLHGFGLNLKQPFEELLDSLLAWALALYRDVIGAPPSAPGRGRAGAERERRTDSAPKPTPKPSRVGSGASSPARPSRQPDPEAIERELAELKRKAGRKA